MARMMARDVMSDEVVAGPFRNREAAQRHADFLNGAWEKQTKADRENKPLCARSGTAVLASQCSGVTGATTVTRTKSPSENQPLMNTLNISGQM